MTGPVVARSSEVLREHVAAWRRAGEGIALVPTMGALHAGHLSLVRTARDLAARTVVSVFVNPAQFAPSEDFDAYPRSFERDLALLAAEGVDLVYAPTAGAMYPEGFATTVTPGGPALAGLEDASRPHFFGGVATVVAKLLVQCAPDAAVFGDKDYQQLLVVRRLAADLDLPVRIVGAATVRDADGLALSSRNAYLTAADRAAAAALPRALVESRDALQAGQDPDTVLALARDKLADAGFSVDYLALRDAETLATPGPVGGRPLRLLVAARLGTTRLIDNVAV